MSNIVRPYFSLYIAVQKIVDLFLPLTTLFVIHGLYLDDWSGRYLNLGLLAGMIFLFVHQLNHGYEAWRGRGLFASTLAVTKSWVLTWLLVLALAFTLKISAEFSRVIIFAWGLSTHILLLVYRTIFRWLVGKLRATGGYATQIVIAGAGQLGKDVAQIFMTQPWRGCNVVGFYDDNADLKGAKFDGIPVLGCLEDLIQDAYAVKFDEVFVTLPLRSEARIRAIIDRLSETSLRVKFVPDLFSFNLLHSKWMDLGGVPVVSVYDSPLDGVGRVVKLVEDMVIAFVVTILLAPLLLLIALAIKLTSRGPVLFKQRRYGIGGNEIVVWKFRTMTVCEDGPHIPQAQKDDVRLTKVGKFLRRTSLDELPQFINVLQGRMSVIGPRPHANAHNEYYRKLIPGYMQRHLLKPGITGWAQVNGWRGETDTFDKMQRRVEYDMDYIKRWSLWFDLKIIVLTIFRGFFNKNAY